LGRTEDALDFFEELANDFPNSQYLPQALLAFGEYYFHLGDMTQAQLFYSAVAEFPDSPIYPYSLYQEAWCFYNTRQYPESVQRLLDAINASSGESTGVIRMRDRALRDLSLFYVEIGTSGEAFDFFESVLPSGEAFDSVALVARIFSEDGKYDEANRLFRELMSRNRESFDVVSYQSEILRNTLTTEDSEAISVEVHRLIEIFNIAVNFDDASEQALTQTGDTIEYQVRQLATTYHREAQILQNEDLYQLAFDLYNDYMDSIVGIADLETRYTMNYYFGELQFRQGSYLDAANTWEACLTIDPNGTFNEEAIYKAVLAYTKMLGTDEMPIPNIEMDELAEGDDAPIPEPQELPDVMIDLLMAADRYLELNPPDEFAVEVEFVAARVLYDYSHLRDSTERFGYISTQYANVDPERARVSAELLLDSLAALHDYEEMGQWIEILQSTSLSTGAFGVRLNELGQQISFGRCRNMQVADENENAGLCFFEFFRSYPDSDLVDSALYNSALAFEAANMVPRAIRVREFLVQYRGASDLAPETRLNLGRSFTQIALYRSASEQYEGYAQDFPDSDQAMEALKAAAWFRHGLEEYDQAISDYEMLIELYPSEDEEVAEAIFQIGVIYEELDQTADMESQLRRYLERYAERGTPGRAIEAATRLGVSFWDRRRTRAEEYFLEALQRYNDLEDETRASLTQASLDAAAEARFMLGEVVFEAFSTISLTGDESDVQGRMIEKQELGIQASIIYEQVRAFSRPGWSIAAFTRLGQLYNDFYDAIVNAPVPEDMPWEVQEQYIALLEEQAMGVRQQAIDNYQIALEIAQSQGWFNEYSALSERNLGLLDPSFRSGSEFRSSPGYETSSAYGVEFLMTLGGDNGEVEEGGQ
jgi:tetratricopeptide (TPR) repeat protein